jgi:feruloyl esterase
MLTPLIFAAGLAAAMPCESLKLLTLSNTTIETVELVPAGPFAAPAGQGGGRAAAAGGRGAADAGGRGSGDAGAPQGRGQGAPPGAAQGGRGQGAPGGPGGGAQPAAAVVPEYCRVTATVTPIGDSRIAIAVFLPSQEWNGKFQAVGNGGWAGNISYPAMASALQEGYATASTDTGHVGGNAAFAIDHPEKLVDFAYRAVHEMTVKAKAFIAAYYGQAPRLSYWNGCSTGGRQGLMAAQKYPEDFDAILAGAPANYQTHLHAWDLSVAVPVLKDPASAVPGPKLALLNRAVLAACDGKDGVKDGFLNDPRACSFDAAMLQCKAGDADTCLTAAQVASVKRAYSAARTSGGDVVFPGKEPGSETTWNAFISNTQQAPGISVGSFQVAYNSTSWDARTFDLDRDLKVVDDKVGSIVNAINPDLKAFKSRGGKLLLYHGWNDTAISPGNAIDYYTSVLKKMGGRQDDFIRLFMAPGMAHCQGGQGPSQVNWMAALERWREGNTAPDRLEAARVANNRIEMTRPLCPYPQIAVYKGVGSTNDASNFVCKAK